MTLLIFDSNFTTITLLGVTTSGVAGGFGSEVDVSGVTGVAASLITNGLTIEIDDGSVLSGVEGDSGIGSLSISSSLMLTAPAAAGQLGTLGAENDLQLGSAFATGNVGFGVIAIGQQVILTGLSSTTFAANLSAVDTIANYGSIAASASTGAFILATLMMPALGAQALSATGTLSAPFMQSVAGCTAVTGVGSFVTSSSTSAALQGVSAAANIGATSLTFDRVSTLSGLAATAANGILVAPAAEAIGQTPAARGQTGILSLQSSSDAYLMMGVVSVGDAGRIKFPGQMRKKAGGRGATRSGTSSVSRQRLPPREHETETVRQMLARWKLLSIGLETPDVVTDSVQPVFLPATTIIRDDSVAEWRKQIDLEDYMLLGESNHDEQVEVEDMILLGL